MRYEVTYRPMEYTRPALTVREVAERLQVGTESVYRCIRSGKLKAVRMGRNYRITEVALDAFMMERETRG